MGCMSPLRPFHIAFPVDDLAAARHFYGTVLGLPEGRSAEQWIDFDLFGHQIVAHHKPKSFDEAKLHSNPVDGHDVPIPHFGVVLTQENWETLAQRLQAAGSQRRWLSRGTLTLIDRDTSLKLYTPRLFLAHTATVKVSSLRETARYNVSRSKGTRPASVIRRSKSRRRMP